MFAGTIVYLRLHVFWQIVFAAFGFWVGGTRCPYVYCSQWTTSLLFSKHLYRARTTLSNRL